MANQFLDDRSLEQYIRSQYAKIQSIAERMQVYRPQNDIFHENTASEDGSYCFSDQAGYHYRVIERGAVITDIVTEDLREITYLVLSNEIFWMAAEYEVKHRIEGQDFRRLLFETELILWNAIGEYYAKRALKKIKNTLQEAPFVED